MTKVRFYSGALPLLELPNMDWLPSRGEYIRLDQDQEAWVVDDVVLVFDGKPDAKLLRLDVALSPTIPGNMPPAPQITRAPSDLVPIPSLEPPEEKERAET